MVGQLPRHVSPDGGIDVADIGHHGLDVQHEHALVSAHPHASAQQRLAIRDRVGHAHVLVMGGGVQAVPGAVLLVVLGGEVVVAQFVPHFALDDLTVFNAQHQVVRRAAKMLADGFTVVGDYRNFHGLLLWD